MPPAGTKVPTAQKKTAGPLMCKTKEHGFAQTLLFSGNCLLTLDKSATLSKEPLAHATGIMNRQAPEGQFTEKSGHNQEWVTISS